MLLFGQRMIPFLFVGLLLSDLVQRQLPLPWLVELSTALMIGGGYAAALMALSHPRLRFDPALSSMRDLAAADGVAVVSAPSWPRLCRHAIAAGLLPPTDFAMRCCVTGSGTSSASWW